MAGCANLATSAGESHPKGDRTPLTSSTIRIRGILPLEKDILRSSYLDKRGRRTALLGQTAGEVRPAREDILDFFGYVVGKGQESSHN